MNYRKEHYSNNHKDRRCWNSVLFGNSYERDCYISRSNVFQYVGAENYYFVKIMMKITNNNSDKAVQGLTTGRIRWTTLSDGVWNSNKQMDFDITADDEWHLYTINMGEKQWWQGDVNNLRIYPFIDGWAEDQFAIKYIKISSLDTWTCANTQCSYYTNYTHLCPGAGRRSSCEAGISRSLYTTVSGVSDELIVNIDNYGEEKFSLGNNINVNGIEMSRIIGNKLSSLSIGGYAFAGVEYSENDKINITSGNAGSTSSIKILASSAAEPLGFYTGSSDVSTYEAGVDPVNGFDYASSRILQSFEINKLIDGNQQAPAYIHNPIQYNVEGGRRDFNEIASPMLTSNMGLSSYYDSLNNSGKTLIELSHPINNSGRIKAIYFYGKIDNLSKIKICRPNKNGTLTVIHSLDLPIEDSNKLYTTHPVNYRLDCNIMVSKGDLIGIYNANLYVGVSVTGQPDATFYQINGEVTGTFDPGAAYTFGIAGFAVYARSDRYQNNVILDIDLGSRVNIEEVNLYGKEEKGYFEFNIASCLDLTWNVDLSGESHYHSGMNWLSGAPFYNTHQNIAYGEGCLDDCIITPDNGKAGDSYGVNANGIWTSGGESYFYVNGDGEWLFSHECTGKTEYCWPNVPGSAFGIRTELTGGFTYDPIVFTLTFPHGFRTKIHKSVMYFKEENNFRSISLSYYLGPDDGTGDADNPYFRLIPVYNSIVLDGLLYDSTNNEKIKDYIFKNPTNQRVIYTAGAAENWEEYRAAVWTDWTIIEHNFDPVDCYGFRIHTNHHYSTKITELEVYSKVETTPSLLDNISLSFSDYGDVWKTATFEEISTEKISAFIGGGPRYITIEVESSTEFNLNEIEFLVGDQVKLEDCDNNILLEESKTGAVNEAIPIVLENIYDKPFDLSIDIPKETSENDDIIFWSKLGSQDEIINPEIGPGCILHKSDDYEIRNDNGQCAIEAPCYGLKNLIHGKEAYVQENGVDWVSYGTLSSGTSLDYCNEAGYKETEVTFDPISSKYWKTFVDTGFVLVTDIFAYYNDVKVPINKVFVGSSEDHLSQIYAATHTNGEDIQGPISLSDDFEDGDYSSWAVGGAGSVTETGGEIYASDYGVGAGWHGPEISRTITSIDNFRVKIEFLMLDDDDSQMGAFELLLLDGSDNTVVKWRATDAWVGSILYRHTLHEKAVLKYSEDGADLYIDGITSNTVEIFRCSNYLICLVNGVSKYAGSFATDSIAKVQVNFYEYADYVALPKVSLLDIELDLPPVMYGDVGIGFGLNSSEPVDQIRMRHVGAASTDMSIWTSPDNTNNYTKEDDESGSVSRTKDNSNYYRYLAIDLEKRHDIDIIRNYGNATNKLFISTSVYTDFSNTITSNADDVVWANSDKDDARWLRVQLLCGDDTTRCLRKLGIYPDISNAYCIDGGYNCEWESFGNILSSYTPITNVAYGATVTGTNYWFRDYYPTNAVDGIFDDYNAQACWGFQKIDGVDPYLEIDFGATYEIYKVKLYHGDNPNLDDYMNKDYTLSVSTSISGSFTNVLSVSSNSEHEVIHQFDPVEARRVRLTITDYDYSRYIVYDEDTQTYVEFEGSFLREIEIYKYFDESYVDSEAWPVVCMNLKDQFDIVDHELVNKDITDSDTDWDNDEEFFKYSDNIWNDPKKVSFTRGGDYITIYESAANSGDMEGAMEYLFDGNVYFEEGRYQVEWYSYKATHADEVSLRLDGGPFVIDDFATVGDGWVYQSGVINVAEAGFYAVKGVQHITMAYKWGIKEPKIFRSYGHTKWAAVTRDVAENYAYDDDANKYGKDYLSLIKVYGDTKYDPLEYYWWWDSLISGLSNDAINVKACTRSLKISYPTSSGIDVVSFIEGDDFGSDNYFSPKDMLSFWWFIDDVSKLDTTFGDITFGILNEEAPIYYRWDINSLNLVSGWNKIEMKFEDYDFTYPQKNIFSLYDSLDESLDFRTNEEDFKSFRLRYRGKGSSFTMNIDSLKIQRNIFDDDVKFGKGLCLTCMDHLEIPLSGLDLRKGTIEFYLKLYCDTYGRDIFHNMSSRTLFTMINNNNDLLALSIKSGNWFELESGQARKGLELFVIDEDDLPLKVSFVRDDVVHIAVTWSNDGRFMDNDDTIRFHINGELICTSKAVWEVGDTKGINIRLGGSNTQMAANKDFFGSGIFDNVKIYNYPKTEFDINIEGIEKSLAFSPNEFLEISSDNINFYGVGSASLPLLFEQVPAAGTRTIYVRSNKNDNFKQSKKTGSLIVQWLTTV